jgi:pimeloyl-ACP methyl ester carboxylesterase
LGLLNSSRLRKQLGGHMRLQRWLIGVIIFSLLSSALPTSAQDGGSKGASAQDIADRQALAQSGLYNYPSGALTAAAIVPLDATQALDIASAVVNDAVYTGNASAAAILNSFGVIQPNKGSSFVLLSSGVAGAGQTEPGTSFGTPGLVGFDLAQLTLKLNVAQSVSTITFDYNFFTAEFPDYVGTIFNDTFQAFITDKNGKREVARASVNSSAFYAASGSVTGGTGFHLFTPNPSGVDTSFGSGLPDAGATRFQSAAFQVESDGVVTLEFVIEDRGDGILDSAVLLDNVNVSSVEIVDPNPELLVGSGSITTDTALLAVRGAQRRGAVADGITQLVARFTAPGQGQVEFCVMGGSTDRDGGFYLSGTPTRNQCVTAPVVNTPRGLMAFANYLVPEEFNTGANPSDGEREVMVRASYSGASPSQTADRTLDLVRPPVVLIHGLWSAGSSFTFPLVNDSRFKVTRADYSGTNASYFSINVGVPGSYVESAVNQLRALQLAATQADIAAHSMGGLLSRLHAQQGDYQNKANFSKGDINKLITLNTPHTGSPFGNLLMGLQAIPVVGDAAVALANYFNHPIDKGAIEDLAKGSVALNGIATTTNVPSHALVGTFIKPGQAIEAVSQIPTPQTKFLAAVVWLAQALKFANYATAGDLFESLESDAIVGRRSQEGGLAGSTLTIFDGLDSLHTETNKSTNYSNRIIQLFNTPANSASFGTFPAPSSLAPVDLSGAGLQPQAAILPGLVISSPATGSGAVAGGTVTVTVTPPTGSGITSVLVVGAGTAEIDSAAPFEITLPIPATALGAFSIAAFGDNGSGDIYVSDPLELKVTVPAALQSLVIAPADPVLTSVGATMPLVVVGKYADGLDRDVTAASTFLSADSSTVSVSGLGVMTATGIGNTTIVAQFGGLQDTTSVSVLLPGNIAPLANAGSDQEVTEGAVVKLNGAASQDPDGGPLPLTYEWQQVAGPAITLSGPFSASPTFTGAVQGLYVFSLVVRDGQADSAPDNVRIGVGVSLGDDGGGGSGGTAGKSGTSEGGVTLLPATGLAPAAAPAPLNIPSIVVTILALIVSVAGLLWQRRTR